MCILLRNGTQSALGAKLRYLPDKEVARLIIEGTYNIPTDLDDATKLISRKLGNGDEDKELGRTRN